MVKSPNTDPEKQTDINHTKLRTKKVCLKHCIVIMDVTGIQTQITCDIARQNFLCNDFGNFRCACLSFCRVHMNIEINC